MTANELIERLGLQAHPEGGWFRETWRDAPGDRGGRAASTAILFLLRAGECSHWHRVDATEIWHYYAGAPLRLLRAADAAGPAEEILLGPDIGVGQWPQGIIPPHHWQAAAATGDYTLVGCTVAPGFEFAGFELAPPDFDIPRG